METPGTSQFRQRPGDQQLPVPNDGPSMHDLVSMDLALQPGTEAIRELLAARRELGLKRYGSLLQAGNSRSGKRDLIEELADATCYARQLREERPASAEAAALYDRALALLLTAFRLPDQP